MKSNRVTLQYNKKLLKKLDISLAYSSMYMNNDTNGEAELLNYLTAKNLFLEVYSRGENIRFMNIGEGASYEPEDVE